MKVVIDDEGQFGPSNFSDDWKEARVENRQPTYVWHEGKYDPKSLASEVGEWNEMLAGYTGAVADETGSPMTLESSIQKFPTFEQLEFNGAKNENVKPFLQMLTMIADQERAKKAASSS